VLCGRCLHRGALLSDGHVDGDEIAEWERANPQTVDREVDQGLYADTHGTPADPHVKLIQELAENGLKKNGARTGGSQPVESVLPWPGADHQLGFRTTFPFLRSDST